MRGRHQAANVAVADALLDALEAAGIATAGPAARRAGYRTARWPGRLELLDVATPSGPREVLLDGAHNPAGAATLAQALDDLRPFLAGGAESPPPPITLVMAMMADKDVAGTVAALDASAALADGPGHLHPGRRRSGDAGRGAGPDLARAVDPVRAAARRRQPARSRRGTRPRPRKRGGGPGRRRRLALPRRCASAPASSTTRFCATRRRGGVVSVDGGVAKACRPAGGHADPRPHVPLGRADLRHGHPQRHPRFVLGRRPAGGAEPDRASRRAGRPDGRRGRRPARHRRRIDPPGARCRRGRRGGRARHPDRGRGPGRAPRRADLDRHDEGRGRPGGARCRGRPRQRRLGRRRGARAAAPRCRPACAHRPDAQSPGGPLHEPDGRDRGGPGGGDRACAGGRGRLGAAHRRSGLRLRQDARAQPRPAARPGCAPGPGPADPARHVAQVDPGPGPRPAARPAPRGDARDDGPRESRRAPTSSGSTTSARTFGPRA